MPNNKKFITVHIVNTLPLHNLNRDQSGQPKSQFDGGVQRGRLSSQSLKRAARVGYRNAGANGSIRTRMADDAVLAEAIEYAKASGLAFDEKKGEVAIKKVIGSLASKSEDAKDSILLFSLAELTSLAQSAVKKQQAGEEPELKDFILDATSPSLDVAAFGRMFANQTDLGTHAAIAVSHATMTHQMALTTDYFTAVEEYGQEHAGAAHLGLAFYTSGVYYRTFTIDADQLRRSWSGVTGEGAAEDLALLVKELILALPTGKVNSTNAHTRPTLVLAELQNYRSAYEFDRPVVAEGGYKENTVKALAASRSLALEFDEENFSDAAIQGETFEEDFVAQRLSTVDEIVQFIVGKVL